MSDTNSTIENPQYSSAEACKAKEALEKNRKGLSDMNDRIQEANSFGEKALGYAILVTGGIPALMNNSVSKMRGHDEAICPPDVPNHKNSARSK